MRDLTDPLGRPRPSWTRAQPDEAKPLWIRLRVDWRHDLFIDVSARSCSFQELRTRLFIFEMSLTMVLDVSCIV